MKIIKLEYENNVDQWKLNPVEFSPNINLLVGISGAGKTKILDSINTLKDIANGKSFNGVRWDVTFSTQDDNITYRWKGEFECDSNKKFRISFIDDDPEDDEDKILYEYLYKDQESLIVRKEDSITFKQYKIPKLSPFESVIELLSQEEDIGVIQQAFDQIMIKEPSDPIENIWDIPSTVFRNHKSLSLNEIKESGLETSVKLGLAYFYCPEVFSKIKEKFIEIFSTVEDIKMETFTEEELSQVPPRLFNIAKEITHISLKEKNVEPWIDQTYLSSGMLKTLIYLIELYLSPDGSVILIDEFENSLGVNCIDSVTDLICENKSLQFIITSHHPYIINNISPEYWKIVTRKGGNVNVKTAEDFQISSSRQKAFLDLINVLEDYPEGLED